MRVYFGLGNIYLDRSINESNERAKTKGKLKYISLKGIQMLINSHFNNKNFC